jgi:carboxyl-terminal processing protease
MLEGNIGLITILNFNEKASDETIKLIEELKNKGATALIFDVRGNPGGSSGELSKILDRILPKDCILFQSESYDGQKQVIRSDEKSLDMPIAVLIDANSYSAAELFAATLVEYNKAFTVGQHTTGKGRYQVNIPLDDGSAIHLSIGRYTTPKGIDLGAAGGIAPTYEVELTKDQQTAFVEGKLTPENDPQVQKAVEELLKKGN